MNTDPVSLKTQGLVAVSHGTVVAVTRKGTESDATLVGVPGLLALSVSVVETVLYLSREDVDILYAITRPETDASAST